MSNVGDTIYREDAIDAVSKACFELRGVFGRCEDALNALPSARTEVTEEVVKDYCRKRSLTILTNDYFHKQTSAQPERLTDDDFEKQIHAMFDHIWDCEIEHPIFQDTVGDLMKAVIQAHNNSAKPERKKGRWIHDGYDFPHGNDWIHCSICGKKGINVPADLTNFCPDCGADMREGGEDVEEA